jgi:uncharacterized repeat protein (TIGR01451 family)
VADTAGNEFEDPIPAGCLYVPLSARVVQGGGTIAFDIPNNRVTWNGNIQPGVLNTVVISFGVLLSDSLPDGAEVANQGNLSWDADGDGTKESSEPSDDPRTPQEDDDATRVVVGQSLADVFAGKTATDVNGGSLLPTENIRYDLVLANSNPAAIASSLLDSIPQNTTYVPDSAQALDRNGDPVGAISYDSSHDRIVWEGNIPATGLVHISFQVKVSAGVPAGTVISNQGTLRYDSDGDGDLDEELLTDDPRTSEPDDPTLLTVSSPAVQAWYLAEGSTGGGMETWLLVQNPGPDAVRVDVILQTDKGPVVDPELTYAEIPASSRRTFNINSYVPDNYNVSTQVNCLDGEVICERAMYGNNRTWAHDSIGYAP